MAKSVNKNNKKRNLINLNDARPIHRILRDLSNARILLARAIHERRNRQPLRKPQIERQQRLKRSLAVAVTHIRNRHIHRQVLARNIHNLELVGLDLAGDAELDRLVLGLQVRAHDRQGLEGGHALRHEIDAGAAGLNHVLQERKRELRALGRQERRCAGHLLLHAAEIPVLLRLLRDDRAEEVDQGQLVAAVGGEHGHGLGEDADDDVSEGVGEGDGGEEVGDGELVGARCDGGGTGRLQDAIGAEIVQFLLVLDGLDHVDDVVAVVLGAVDVVAVDVVGDVVEERAEVGDFEGLVQRDQLHGCDRGGGELGRERAARETAAGELLDGCELGGAGVWVAISLGSSEAVGSWGGEGGEGEGEHAGNSGEMHGGTWCDDALV